MRQSGCPSGSAGRPGTLVWWRQGSPTWPSVGPRRVSPATVGASAGSCGWCPGLVDLTLGGWPPGGLLAGGRVGGLGVGDGGHAGQGHGGQCGPHDEGAWHLDTVAPHRSAGAVGAVGWLVGGHAWPPGASRHQPRPVRRRRRRGGRVSPTSRAWSACSWRSVMRWSASAWLSPACWLCMDLIPSCSSAAWIVAGSGWAGARRPNLAGAIRSAMACSLSLVAGFYGPRFALAGRGG
jgi:hypothetical protein